MDESARLILTGVLSAGGGAFLTRAADWLFSRSDRKAKAAAEQADREAKAASDKADRERQQADANDALAARLREELRGDNTKLLERVARLEGQVIELNKTNDGLRKENLELVAHNARQAGKLEVQAVQLQVQDEKLTVMQTRIEALQDHNAALEAALKAANIEVPQLRRRVSDTGPLGSSALAG